MIGGQTACVMALDCDQLYSRCTHAVGQKYWETHSISKPVGIDLIPVFTGEMSNGLECGRKLILAECFLASSVNVCHCAWPLALTSDLAITWSWVDDGVWLSA